MKRIRVAYIAGQYSIFNNMIVDVLKDLCRGSIYVDYDSMYEVLGDLGDKSIDIEEERDSLYSVDIDTFISVSANPPASGKWFCRADGSDMTSSRVKKLQDYTKSPSEFGVIAVVYTKFDEYKKLLYSREIEKSDSVALVSLSFPKQDDLKKAISVISASEGIKLKSKAVENFINRMGTEYDMYPRMLARIAENNPYADVNNPVEIESSEVTTTLRGIEFYNLDDFIRAITNKMSSDKMNSKKTIRMIKSLTDMNKSSYIVNKLRYKVDECIEFRIMINKGIVPVGINFFYKDVLNRLGPGNKYEKMPEWQFKKKCELAVMTSLRDWLYIKFILQKPSKLDGEEVYKKALYEVATRSILCESRINNIIGVESILDAGIDKIDRIKYCEGAV